MFQKVVTLNHGICRTESVHETNVFNKILEITSNGDSELIFVIRDSHAHAIGLAFNIIYAIDIAFMVTHAEIQTKSCSWGAFHFNRMIVNNNIEFTAVVLMIAIQTIAFKTFHINLKHIIRLIFQKN